MSLPPSCSFHQLLLLASRLSVIPGLGGFYVSQAQGGNHCRWQVPSLNGSLILPSGPTEAVRVDVSESWGKGPEFWCSVNWRGEELNLRMEREIAPGHGWQVLPHGNPSRRGSSPSETGKLGRDGWGRCRWGLSACSCSRRESATSCLLLDWTMQTWASTGLQQPSWPTFQDQIRVWKISLDEILTLDFPLVLVDEHCSWICFELDTWEELAGWLSSEESGLPMQETRVWSLGLEDPLEKEMANYSSILAW